MSNATTTAECGLQVLVGAALVDAGVREALLRNPLDLARRFEMSLRERRFLAAARPRSLEHFAALVEEWIDGVARIDQPMAPAMPTRLAG